MWLSSLTDSTAKGKPDIEAVDVTSRMQTVGDIVEVTTKPIVYDGDTGGKPEHFVFTVKTLERLGVSAVVIEDKRGLKRNSLFGTDANQAQDSIEDFCHRLAEGKRAQVTSDFMIIARIESLILGMGMEDAVDAGGGVHRGRRGRDHDPQLRRRIRARSSSSPSATGRSRSVSRSSSCPSTYNTVREEELAAAGVNVVIYANQLLRSAYPAMAATARSILEHGRSHESDGEMLPIGEVLRLIPGGA